MIEEIMEAISLCAGHREMVQEKLGELVQVYRRKLERMLTGVDDETTPGREDARADCSAGMGKEGDFDEYEDAESHMGLGGGRRRGTFFGNISPIGSAVGVRAFLLLCCVYAV